jgi:hypothetical protein
MADWLDDDKKVHQCNLEHALLGAEVMLALQQSAACGGQIALPLKTGADEVKALQQKMPDRPVLLSMAANAREYGQA